MRIFTFFCLMMILSITQVSAQEQQGRRGLITTSACPYSCRDAGIPKDQCRESRSGDACEVEDFSQPPGHRSVVRVNASAFLQAEPKPANAAQSDNIERRGLVTSSSCPYTCSIAGISAQSCREWRNGDTCYVEDLLQAPGHRSRVSY